MWIYTSLSLSVGSQFPAGCCATLNRDLCIHWVWYVIQYVQTTCICYVFHLSCLMRAAVLRYKLSRRFNACIQDRPCPRDCEHKAKTVLYMYFVILYVLSSVYDSSPTIYQPWLYTTNHLAGLAIGLSSDWEGRCRPEGSNRFTGQTNIFVVWLGYCQAQVLTLYVCMAGLMCI